MNNTEINEIKVNGIDYVRKDSVSAPSVSRDTCIVRCKEAGVFFGQLELTDLANGGKVVMKNARRLWYWSGAASLSQLAVDGTSKPNDCKFPVAVPEITLAGCIEIIPCTEKAAQSINSVKVWKA